MVVAWLRPAIIFKRMLKISARVCRVQGRLRGRDMSPQDGNSRAGIFQCVHRNLLARSNCKTWNGMILSTPRQGRLARQTDDAISSRIKAVSFSVRSGRHYR